MCFYAVGVVQPKQNGVETMLFGAIKCFYAVVIEASVIVHALTPDVEVFAKALKLSSIGEGALAIYAVVFLESAMYKSLVFFGESCLMFIAHGCGGNTPWVMVAAMQSRLIDQRCLTKEPVFTLH